jgi:acetyl esterase/lipase
LPDGRCGLGGVEDGDEAEGQQGDRFHEQYYDWVQILLLLLLAQTPLRLWPDAAKGPAERDTTTEKDALIAGKRVERITDVVNPTLTFYPAPPGINSGAAVVVFPGGGYRILASDLEGTEVCTWLNSIGVNCAVLKYRVPNAGPNPQHPEDLADAQRAVRMMREHAAEWKIDSGHVGVLGFSAGGHLAAALSNHPEGARPDFAVLIYPGLLVNPPDLEHLRAEVAPSSETPPTFLVQAEDDPVHVENTLAYYAALARAKVPSEMHVFAKGGHGYGLRPSPLPITDWPQLAGKWLRTIGVLR